MQKCNKICQGDFVNCVRQMDVKIQFKNGLRLFGRWETNRRFKYGEHVDRYECVSEYKMLLNSTTTCRQPIDRRQHVGSYASHMETTNGM